MNNENLKLNWVLDKRYPLKKNRGSLPQYAVRLKVYDAYRRKNNYLSHFGMKTDKLTFEKALSNKATVSEQSLKLRYELDEAFLIIRSIIKENEITDFQKLKRTIKKRQAIVVEPNKSSESGLWFYFEKKIGDIKNKNHSSKTIEIYKTIYNHIVRYDSKIDLNEIDFNFLMEFEKYLQNNHVSATSINIYMRSLKAVYNHAITLGLISDSPFVKYKIPVGSSNKKALNHNQLNALINSQCFTIHQEIALKYFQLMYECCGANLVDLLSLKWRDIQNYVIRFERIKTINTSQTRKQIEIPIKESTLRLLLELGCSSEDENDFILPIFRRENSLEKNKKLGKNFLKKINKKINKIIEINQLGIAHRVTSYTARYTFATLALRGGHSVELISELLGHSSIMVTQKYLKGFDIEQKNNITNLFNYNKK